MKVQQRPTLVRSFRVSVTEDEHIRSEAARRGMTITKYLRSIVLPEAGRQSEKSNG